jgi:flagellar P-ring protein precursor FlgI
MKKLNLRFLATILVAASLIAGGFPTPAYASSRIKDIVDIEGVRENMLVGYGLVVGLNGTGDSLRSSPFTQQSLLGMLERLGVNVRSQDMQTKNVAAVMVTATLPAFATQGSRIDVTVSALGDCKSLLGGTLLVTPLLGADSQVYAVSQGPVATGGFSASGDSGSNVTKNVPTAGRISSGAIVEREIQFSLAELKTVRLALRNPDFTTAQRIAQAIDAHLGHGTATVLDPANVQVAIPLGQTNVISLITDIEQLPITPDEVAKVVINEASGIIVMGDKVRISTVAIAQGNLTVRVTETPEVSQPAPFSETGETTVVPRTSISIDEQSGRKIAVMPEGVTLHQLVESLNALGVGPRDIISILQAIKAAGALQAEIEVI